MENRVLFILIVLMIALMGCDSSSSNKSNISYTISGDTLDLSLKNDKHINVSIIIADENISFTVDGSGKYSIISIISQESQNTNEIALAAAKNSNNVDFFSIREQRFIKNFGKLFASSF